MKKFAIGALALAVCAAAWAQFAPNVVLRAEDLNRALAQPTITGGTINGAPIGSTNPKTASFTDVTVSGTITAASIVGPITGTVAASSLTGTTVAANVVNASLSSIAPAGGTLAVGGIASVTGLRMTTSSTPASSSATCTTGMMAWDTSFLYMCVATNTWRRSQLLTW